MEGRQPEDGGEEHAGAEDKHDGAPQGEGLPDPSKGGGAGTEEDESAAISATAGPVLRDIELDFLTLSHLARIGRPLNCFSDPIDGTSTTRC